jgi:2-polyprenyl-3-methyl-5-hydroxy-6-metoxy-1,4-benzoquinol methylase
MLAAFSRITGRNAILLPAESLREESMLRIRTVYRVEGPTLSASLNESCPGKISATLLGYNGHFPTNILWSSPWKCYSGPCEFTFDITNGQVRLSGEQWGRAPQPARRFCWHFVIEGTDGQRRERLTGHYRAVDDREIDSSYYEGDNYVDHEAQSQGEHQQVLQLLKEFNAKGPVLEIGCATGGLLETLNANGFKSVGVDISEWAVARANERLGATRAWVCNVESDSLPIDLVSHAPFGSIVLWAVFEHFHDPFDALTKITSLAAPAATLLINTTNADSLTSLLFGQQWEGFFDWTHHGVDKVSVKSLREYLPQIGWRIEYLTTHMAWDCDADPTRATLRDWWAVDARFRLLLAEREAGDLIICVAVKK